MDLLIAQNQRCVAGASLRQTSLGRDTTIAWATKAEEQRSLREETLLCGCW